MTDRSLGVGLTSEAARRLLAESGPNELPPPHRPWFAVDVGRRCAEPLNAILLVAAVLTVIVLDETAQGVGIGFVAVGNALMSALLERRADDASRQLAGLASPRARVERDGRTMTIHVRDIVVGDLVLLAGGDRVPADLAIVESNQLLADESMLTGESLPVAKSTGDPNRRSDQPPVDDEQAFSGTLVTAGTARALVTATGTRTRLGAIARMLETPAEATPLERSLQSLTRRLGVGSVLLGIGATALTYVREHDAVHRFGDAVLFGVALAVAAVPEGLPTAVTTSLAVAGVRLARHGAIVRSLAALEGLGRASVLCTDKTGTLTTGHLEVVSVVADDHEALWRCALRCNDADATADAVDVALRDAAPPAIRTEYRELGERVSTTPFDPVRRMMQTVHRVVPSSVGHIESIKGAPEQILALCADDATRSRLTTAAHHLTDDGHRVLAFAERSSTEPPGSGGPNTDLFRVLGLVAFGDPLRPSAASAVAAAREAGIRVVMVTGDHAGTARAIAAQAGIPGDPLVSGEDLAVADPGTRRSLLASAAVVARVDPGIKLELIDALHHGGAVVAMTGDGVNDAPALRRADIGIAVGGPEATDVARAAAAVVLGDGELGTVVMALEQGRRIHRNLQATIAYLLTGNASEILVIVGSLLFLPHLATPLLAVHLLWVNLVTDTFPALALGIDASPLPGQKRPSAADDFLGRRAVTILLTRALLLASTVLVSTIGRGGTQPEIRTQLVASLVSCHLLLAFVARGDGVAWARGWRRSAPLLAAVAGGLLLQAGVAAIPATRSALEITPISIETTLRAAIAVTLFVATSALGARFGLRATPTRDRSFRENTASYP